MNPIDILIIATWRGKQAIQTAKGDLSTLDTSTKQSAADFAKFTKAAGYATLALSAIAVEARIAYKELDRAAGLDLTRRRFDRLAESIGTTGKVLREDLTFATRGLLTTAQQMALATDLVALGLVNTHDEAVRFARVVTELDQDIGELVLALSNQTTRRFDQLGVSVFGFQERLDRLKGTMSDEDAFTMAFLEQAEAQIERVGGKAGTSAGDIQAFESSIGELRDTLALALLELVAFSGGFDGLREATAFINELSEDIRGLGEQLDKIAAINKILSTDPSKIAEGVRELLAAFEVDKIMAAAEEAESFDRVLTRIVETARELNYELSKLGDSLPDRGGRGRNEDIIKFTQERNQERADLFEDFQEDITSITEREEERRAAITEQYESQRTEIVANYNRQRAREEEDWALRRARQEEDYRKSIEAARESAAEAERDARNDANDQLEDLERDHLKRMQDIIENASLQLKEASSRLDAGAVARITRELKKAKRDERENYADQRREIQEALDEQLAAIRENMEQRLADLEEFNAERQQREEEDRALRLARMQEDFKRQLDELKQQERDRLSQMKREFAIQKQERTTQYIDERSQLTSHWRDKEQIEATYMERILEAEAEWWQSRLDLVGGKGGGATGGGTGDGGGATGGTRPTRTQLEQMAIGQMQAANWPDGVIFSQLRTIRGWTDAVLAKWIEDIFGFDVPGYRAGIDRVPKSGLAFLHEDETVLNPAKAAQYRAGQLGGFSPTYNIYPSAGMDETAFAHKVKKVTEKTMTEFYERMAG